MNRWTTNQLKDRQRKEVQNGGFGKVTFASKVQFLDDVENVEATKHEVAEKKMDTVVAAGTCKEMIHDSQDMIVTIQDENTYRDGYYDEHNDYSTQDIVICLNLMIIGAMKSQMIVDIVNEVKRNVAVITSAKSLVYENISKGLDMFPNNKDLLTLEKECDVLFGENSHGVNVHQDGNGNKENVNDSYVEVPGIITQTLTDHVIFDKILESSISKVSMKVAECKYKGLQPININFSEDGVEENDGNISVLDSDSKYKTGEVTPEMVQDVVTKLDASRIKPFQKSLVSSIDPEPKAVKDDNKGNDKKQKGRPRSLNELVLGKIRAKREVKIPDSLKSPYITWIVDCKKRLKADEKKVSNWLFACTEDENEIIFEAHGRLIGYKGIMESLRPGSKIHATVVDIWVAIQNDLEKRPSNSASSRVFVHSDIMGHEKLTNIELVCFPIVQSGHFYYITFNLMKDEVDVIDNLTICPNYKELLEKLVSKFAGYLTEIKHRKAVAIGKVKPVRLEFSWQSRSNFIDCGVFLMRHMEIYKGMHKMEDGLAQDGFGQQEQLNDLRKKYATKILLADINKHKEALMRKVNIFDKLTKEDKKMLNHHGLVVGESRVASFG
ncbi:ulp1 protease family, C-terminal catalytic domain-containing protein [Tanacetum coccineum]